MTHNFYRDDHNTVNALYNIPKVAKKTDEPNVVKASPLVLMNFDTGPSAGLRGGTIPPPLRFFSGIDAKPSPSKDLRLLHPQPPSQIFKPSTGPMTDAECYDDKHKGRIWN